MAIDYKVGKKFRLKGPKKYFELKYGNAYPVIEIREELDFHKSSSPPTFLYIGRALTEGNPELLRGKTYYGYIEGTGEGEFVHESELATLVTDITPGRVDEFHAHLDVCQQCRDNPFDLCPIGATLLKAAAEKPYSHSAKNG